MRKHSYRIPWILNKVGQITSNFETLTFLGVSLTGETFEYFVSCLGKQLSPRIQAQVLADSILELAGQELTVDKLQTTAWRLAGNVTRLSAGHPVPPWSKQPDEELVPAQITNYRVELNRFNKIGGEFQFRILAGSCCPMLLTTFWTQAQCQMIARRIGFTSAVEAYPYRQPSELVNMRLNLKLEPDLSMKKPGFNQVQITPSLQKWNRTLLAKRERTTQSKFKCPKDFEHPCHQCPIGYRDCEAAVHPETYVTKHCQRCDQDTMFDPVYPKSKLCVNCTRVMVFKQEKEE